MTPAVDDPNETKVTKITEDNKDTATGNPLVLFDSAAGNSVIAAGSGTVQTVTTDVKFGNMVTIDHGYGYKTRYAHLQKAAVRKGQRMKRGQLIGFIGNTGKTTGVHLHYEVLKNDVPINPINFFYNDLTPDEYEQILEQSTLPTQTMD